MSKKKMIVRICSVCGKHIIVRHYGTNFSLARTWTDFNVTKGIHHHQLVPAWLLLVKCPHCSELLWIEEQEKAFEIQLRPDGVLPEGDKNVKKAYHPTWKDYFQFARANERDREKEEYAQIRAWMARAGLNCQGDETGYQKELSELPDTFKDAKLGSEPTFMEYIDFLSAGIHDQEKEEYLRLHAWWAGNNARRQGGQTSPMTQAERINLRAFLPCLKEGREWERLIKAEGFRELGEFAAAEKLLANQFEIRLMERVLFIRDLNQKQNTSVEEIASLYQNENITGWLFDRRSFFLFLTGR
jgi:sarcosine oxidase delta subunit